MGEVLIQMAEIQMSGFIDKPSECTKREFDKIT